MRILLLTLKFIVFLVFLEWCETERFMKYLKPFKESFFNCGKIPGRRGFLKNHCMCHFLIFKSIYNLQVIVEKLKAFRKELKSIMDVKKRGTGFRRRNKNL